MGTLKVLLRLIDEEEQWAAWIAFASTLLPLLISSCLSRSSSSTFFHKFSASLPQFSQFGVVIVDFHLFRQKTLLPVNLLQLSHMLVIVVFKPWFHDKSYTLLF